MSSDQRVHQQIRHWARDLIDLTRRNRSLFYKPLKTSTLALLSPAPADIFDALMGGETRSVYVPRHGDAEEPWTVRDCIEDAEPRELVSERTRAREALRSLKSLHRHATQDLMDRGIQTLYLCFGMLEWTERDRGDDVRSPLVFVPIVLEREGASDRFSLARSDEDVVLNPSLAVLLQEQYDVDLQSPDFDLQEADDLGAILDHVRGLVRGRGWSIEPTAIVKRATFHKEAMYRDLLDNIDTIAAHEIVRSLAGDEREGNADDVEIPDEADIDGAAPPEDANLILSADASQRRAVEAARRGASFVMDGPPGTGKSQTIANMTAQLLADGRSVLFVSEKAAALEVVATRLAERHLAEFVLELHSHKASRKEVVQALSNALGTRVTSKATLSSGELDAARKRRQQLSAYAAAVNEVRQPLGRPIAWVAGRLAQLAHLPKVPTPSTVDRQLTDRDANQLRDRFDELARVWAPVDDPDFAWRGFAGETLSATEQATLERELEAFEQLVDDLADAADELAYDMRQPAPADVGSCRDLLGLARHVTSQPTTVRRWWLEPLEPIEDRLAKLREVGRSRADDIDALAATYGNQWRELSPDDVDRLAATVGAFERMRPSLTIEDGATPAQLRETARALRDLASAVQQLNSEVAHIEAALGLPRRERSLSMIIDLASVAKDADAAERPEASWATPAVMRRVRAAVSLLQPLVDEHAERNDALMSLFTEDVYDLDLETIAARLEQNTGLKKLGAAYRGAKKELASVSRGGRATKEVREAVADALAAQQVRRQLDDAEDTHRELLGRHYQQRATDSAIVGRAVELLSTALEKLGDDYRPDRIAAQLAGEGPEDPFLGQRAGIVLDQLSSAMSEVEAHLPGSADLNDLPFAAAERWCLEAAEQLDLLAAILGAALQIRTMPARRSELVDDLRRRRRVRDADNWADDAWDADHAMFGSWYEGFDTHWSGLEAALGWVRQLQTLLVSPLDERSVDRLFATTEPPQGGEVADLVDDWNKSTSSLLGRFDDPYRQAHDVVLRSSFEDARGHLATLRDRIEEPRIWLDWTRAVASLNADGWHAALTACRDERVGREELSGVLEQAMYAAWFDDVIDDKRLRTLRGGDRDALVHDFVAKDRRLADNAVERVIAICNNRRPTTQVGAVATIEREAQKKRRHMPVRRLLEQTVEVATDLKPCFMMSPLSVSQFLPSTYRFDVVIFDEASQITPADAINCVYRGHQLIVAGDDKQLPPTSFFDNEMSDGDDAYDEEAAEDFESVLGLAKGSAVMRAFPLRWHYRSQHEGLITYSNYQFYDGKLVTYPGAAEERDDLGVTLIVTDGQYRRGARRDNPIEAEEVARRVHHHAVQHPGRSLGVVAFSRAQAEAVEDAVDRLRQDHPELESYFDASRLDGFFVKNLENAQGDERDIIIFTVGYGPDEVGKFTMNLGPINRAGGWRRLNVAVTRARRRVEVVTSFRPEQLDARNSSNEGLAALQRYLDYAQRGIVALAIDPSQEDGDIESPLELAVRDTIESWGYDVTSQVGSAGYRVDLGVRDPELPGRFMLGVECDGRQYHSSRIARDRDRLRQEVLERLGWRLHRIWGPAWYRDRASEEQRLRDVLDAAAAGAGQQIRPAPQRPVSQPRRVTAFEIDDRPAWVETYTVAHIGGRRPRGRANDPANRPVVQAAVEQVVKVEGPVHLEVVGRRIADHFGHNLTRATMVAVGGSARALARRDRIRLDDEIASISDDVPVRVPDERRDDTQRAIQHIPPAEVAAAVHGLLGDARVATKEQLLLGVRDLFGYRRMGARIEAALEAAVARLQAEGRIAEGDDGRLRVVTS